ncbi:MAG: RNA polymerase sigma factor [Planctomycetaceae bacterium]
MPATLVSSRRKFVAQIIAQRNSAAAAVCQRGLSAGDFEQFVRDYTGRLLVVANRLLRSEEDAADAVQDAFLSALTKKDTFQGESTVYTWLYRIVVNTCLMRIRSKPQTKTDSLEVLQSTFDEQRRHTSRESVENNGAEDRLESEETRVLVRACIDRLPVDYRAILVLRDIEELDTETTAALLNLSRSAVKTRLHRARQALRTLLEPLLYST